MEEPRRADEIDTAVSPHKVRVVAGERQRKWADPVGLPHPAVGVGWVVRLCVEETVSEEHGPSQVIALPALEVDENRKRVVVHERRAAQLLRIGVALHEPGRLTLLIRVHRE